MGRVLRKALASGLVVVVAVALGLALRLRSGQAWADVIATSKTPVDGRQVRKAECTLGDLVADAARARMKADVALIQAGQLREQVIPAGDLTEEQLRSALLNPDEKVVLVEIRGDKLQAALERGLSALPQPSIGFLQVSGVQVKFRSQSQPNHRIESIQEGEVLRPAITVGDKPLEAQRTYRAAVPATLAKGALGYFRIFDGLKVKETGPEMAQAVCDYVRESGVVNLAAGDRLRDLSPPAGK